MFFKLRSLYMHIMYFDHEHLAFTSQCHSPPLCLPHFPSLPCPFLKLTQCCLYVHGFGALVTCQSIGNLSEARSMKKTYSASHCRSHHGRARVNRCLQPNHLCWTYKALYTCVHRGCELHAQDTQDQVSQNSSVAEEGPVKSHLQLRTFWLLMTVSRGRPTMGIAFSLSQGIHLWVCWWVDGQSYSEVVFQFLPKGNSF